MNWVDGDILDFERGVICNVVNPDGTMGAGLALQIARKWPHVEAHYKASVEYSHANNYWGNVYTKVNDGLFVCGMFAMASLQTPMPRFRYTSFVSCLHDLRHWYESSGRSAANMPVLIPCGMGAGLAGGNWPLIERMIQEIMPSATIVRYNKGQ